ncbi:hypothetical protein B0H13DRAFT_2449085 [Mycena leptocephala]|nr:hypothetical protein B0H13DRAFT_2449085 [Mycena leptocephala]
MRALQLSLALAFFTSSCDALPITTTNFAAPSVAAFFAVLVALLLLLVLVKGVYVRKSRRMIQAQQHSTLTHSVPRTKDTAAFLVGFLGDPTVEIQSALRKAEWTENQQSSFKYRIHTESRRHGLEYPAVLEIRGRFRNRSVPNKQLVLPESHSFKLPSFPDKVRINSSARRFSLPTIAHDSKRRRHSKSARSRRSVTFTSGSRPSHRTADPSPGRDASLPLSPQLSEVSATSTAPSSVPASGPFSPRLVRSFIPPLPPLRFAHSPPSNTERKLSHLRNNEIAAQPQTDPKQQGDQVVPTTVIDCIQVERTSVQALSPTLSSFPPPPPVAGILKPKLRVRTRRSPAIGPIGPSPVRKMILLKALNSELSSYAQNRFNQSPRSLGSRGGVLRVSDVGSNSETHQDASRGKRRQSSVSSIHTSKLDDDNNPDVLLGIIREPVEETSQCHQRTVSINQSPPQDSGFMPSRSARDGFAETEVTSSGCDGESAEVELQLLGLDISKSESFDGVGTSKPEDAANLVSFWDDGERSSEVV